MEHRCVCGLKWWLEEHKEIQREKGSLDCDCGQQILEWSDSVWYTKMQMFDDPITTTAELDDDSEGHIPVGSLIEVFPIQSHDWDREKKALTTYRTIKYAGRTTRVKEFELLAAIGAS